MKGFLNTFYLSTQWTSCDQPGPRYVSLKFCRKNYIYTKNQSELALKWYNLVFFQKRLCKAILKTIGNRFYECLKHIGEKLHEGTTFIQSFF